MPLVGQTYFSRPQPNRCFFRICNRTNSARCQTCIRDSCESTSSRMESLSVGHEEPATHRQMSEKVDLMEGCSLLGAIQTMAMRESDAFALLAPEPNLGKLGRIVETFGLQSIDWTGALRVANQWYNRLVTAMNLPSYSDRKVR